MKKDPNAAKGYAWEAERKAYRPLPFRALDTIAAAGAINSNVMDMSRWVRFQLGRGVFEGKRLLSSERLEETWQKQIVMAGSSDYGLGWMLHTRDNHRVVEHGGNIDGFAAEVGLFPDDNIGFVMLTSVTATSLQGESLGIVYESLLGDLSQQALAESARTEPGPPRPVRELERYVGSFERPGAVEAQITIQDAQLVMSITGQPTMILNWPDKNGRWSAQAIEGLAISFKQLENGYVPAMTIHQSGANVELRRRQESPLGVDLTVDQLMDLRAAAHGSEHADFENFRLTGTARYVHQGLTGIATLVAAGPDQFSETFDYGHFFWARVALDHEHAFSRSAVELTPLAELEGQSRETVLVRHPMLLYGDWRELYQDLAIVGKDSIQGEEVIVVRATRKSGSTIKYLVSAKSHLLVAAESTSGFGPMGTPGKVFYEDYQDVHGVRMPFRIWQENEAMGRLVIQYQRADIDVDIPKDTFTIDQK
jgi:hypothetical protein